jgi:hypothetical protein
MSGPAKAARTTPPRLSGNVEYDRGAEDDLEGVLARIITGFTGTGGVADLELKADNSEAGEGWHARTSYHFIARKFWRDAAGGPRIELLEIKKFQAPPTGRWVNAYEKLELKANEWARVHQTLSCSRANSKMMAEWMHSKALTTMEEENRYLYHGGDVKSVTLRLRIFDMPAMEVIARPMRFGGEGEPWTDDFSSEVDKAEETLDVEKIKTKVAALRFYMDRKKAALEHLVRTWDAVEIPLGEI